MKIDLKDGLSQEIDTILRCFYPTPGNSFERKMALLVAVAIFFFGGLGILFGLVDLSEPGAAGVWTLIVGVMGGLFGATREKEKQLMREE